MRRMEPELRSSLILGLQDRSVRRDSLQRRVMTRAGVVVSMNSDSDEVLVV